MDHPIPLQPIQVSPEIELKPVLNQNDEEIINFYLEAWNDKDVRKYIPPPDIPFPWTIEGSMDFVNSNKPYFKINDCRVLYKIVTTDGMQGDISLIYYPEFDHYRIGYSLKKSAWGKGLTTVCINKALDYFFNNFSIDKVETYVDPENTGSSRVLEKNGFKLLDKKIVTESYRWDEANEIFDSSVIIQTKCKLYSLNKNDFKLL